MLCYIMLCYVMLCYVMLRYVMLNVMLYYVMLCYVMLCYVMLCYVMLCYVMLCYVINNNTFVLPVNDTKFRRSSLLIASLSKQKKRLALKLNFFIFNYILLLIQKSNLLQQIAVYKKDN